MEEQCYALLIDADNVSAKYIKPILTELSKYGIITYKRIYGDWTSTQHSSWKDELLTNSITPIQQFSYTQGKNSTDSAMIIDAMDILYINFGQTIRDEGPKWHKKKQGTPTMGGIMFIIGILIATVVAVPCPLQL